MSLENRPTICIIGLGLIGGSLAYALRGFHDCTIIGVDINKQSVGAALKSGAIDKAYDTPDKAIPQSDLVILCVFPQQIHDIVIENASLFKPGAIVCDVCGTKEHLYGGIHQYIPENIDYIGIHPMAGKEVDGFANADGSLFDNTGFIITPLDKTKQSSIEAMEEIAGYIGAKRIAISSLHEHDSIIAYTSDLMHIAAAGLCADYHPKTTGAYTAGAFRDCTRVANLNPDLWTELFLANRLALVPTIDSFISSVQQMRDAIATEDKDALHMLLKTASDNKRELLKR